jgi:hypothetical protein
MREEERRRRAKQAAEERQKAAMHEHRERLLQQRFLEQEAAKRTAFENRLRFGGLSSRGPYANAWCNHARRPNVGEGYHDGSSGYLGSQSDHSDTYASVRGKRTAMSDPRSMTWNRQRPRGDDYGRQLLPSQYSGVRCDEPSDHSFNPRYSTGGLCDYYDDALGSALELESFSLGPCIPSLCQLYVRQWRLSNVDVSTIKRKLVRLKLESLCPLKILS